MNIGPHTYLGHKKSTINSCGPPTHHGQKDIYTVYMTLMAHLAPLHTTLDAHPPTLDPKRSTNDSCGPHTHHGHKDIHDSYGPPGSITHDSRCPPTHFGHKNIYKRFLWPTHPPWTQRHLHMTIKAHLPTLTHKYSGKPHLCSLTHDWL